MIENWRTKFREGRQKRILLVFFIFVLPSFLAEVMILNKISVFPSSLGPLTLLIDNLLCFIPSLILLFLLVPTVRLFIAFVLVCLIQLPMMGSVPNSIQ